MIPTIIGFLTPIILIVLAILVVKNRELVMKYWWGSLIPILGVVLYFGYGTYFSKEVRNQKENEIHLEKLAKQAEEKARRAQKFGPWTIGELEDEGWTSHQKIEVPCDKPRPVNFEWKAQNTDMEFETNPPRKNVRYFYQGNWYKLNGDPGKKRRDGLTRNKTFNFQSFTGKPETVYIRERPLTVR